MMGATGHHRDDKGSYIPIDEMLTLRRSQAWQSKAVRLGKRPVSMFICKVSRVSGTFARCVAVRGQLSLDQETWYADAALSFDVVDCGEIARSHLTQTSLEGWYLRLRYNANAAVDSITLSTAIGLHP